MSVPSYEQLNTIRFETQLLPKWAQLLDLAARLCPVSVLERRWFAKFTRASGVDDAKTIGLRCEALRTAILARGAVLFTDLQMSGHDAQPAQIIGGWLYSLDTIIMMAKEAKSCSWTVEGTEAVEAPDSGGSGELRRL